jgi:AcrR family transcriptional regulator
VRRRQIAEAATALLLEQSYLPLRMEALATRAGVSKGLVYGYFPTQHALFNAILADEMGLLRDAGLEAAGATADFTKRAIACAAIYVRHIAGRGPVIHYILRDGHMAGHLDPAATALRDRLLRGFARSARRDLRLPPAEATAATAMVAAIPEEMGRLAWQGELALDRAEELNAHLVASAISSLKPA